MAENNTISLKVFLRDEGATEARRFTVDASVVTSYIFMKEKLQTIFPNLRNSIFKITWKDSDGDEITVASDEDFITAFTEMNNDVKVLYITVVQHASEPVFTIDAEIQGPQYEGPRIICDVCNQVVAGFRYKCLQCPDYDLCANCEHQGHHSEHLMMRVPNTDVYMPKCARKFMHHVARNLKKSAYVASKEAHRAAKFAHKFGNQGRCGAQPDQDKTEQAQAGSSAQEPQESGSCPFAPAEGINLEDVHALGALARQHFGPILDALRTAPKSGDNTTNAANDGMFMDVIRNAVDGFFGGKGTEQPSSFKTPESTVDKQPDQQEVPMDVEGANKQENSAPTQEKEKREPGWTFVANNSQPESISNEVTQNAPSAPAFVYHENPKIAEGLVQLHEMGFSNESGYLTHLLERYEGNVNAVVKAVLDMRL